MGATATERSCWWRGKSRQCRTSVRKLQRSSAQRQHADFSRINDGTKDLVQAVDRKDVVECETIFLSVGLGPRVLPSST